MDAQDARIGRVSTVAARRAARCQAENKKGKVEVESRSRREVGRIRAQ